jgi:hypothetical protein
VGFPDVLPGLEFGEWGTQSGGGSVRGIALSVCRSSLGVALHASSKGKEGEPIVKAADGPQPMTVAEIDAMLYLGSHSREQLERALRLPALSPGWKASFHALLEQALTGNTAGGNPGFASASGPPQ